MTNDFLLEIFTEELPPKNLKRLAESLNQHIYDALDKAHLTYQKNHLLLATPRRLAVIVKNLQAQQADQLVERKGPSTLAAFDKGDNPTKAALGFAKSCGVPVDQLNRLQTEKGEFLVFQKKQAGLSVFECLPKIVTNAIHQLPVAKYMRWSDQNTQFSRPVHSVIMLYGKKIIPAKILGHQTSNKTQGHRVHSKKELMIKSSKDYISILQKQGKVIVDFDVRKETIRKQITLHAKKCHGKALINEDLLEEVTASTEWPVVCLAHFPKHFLKLPREALIASIQKHQRCFPVVDKKHTLLPYFIMIANLKNWRMRSIIRGNERVMNARLSDAAFFYETDIKMPLEKRNEQLKHVVYQIQLGSVFDKVLRIQTLVETLAEQLNVAGRAALLSKADLMTNMVGEFPELQGIMGYYYALYDKEREEIAVALKEQYLPKSAEDELPESTTGQILAIADRIDTLVGLFGIDKMPTGDKDPFALRRAALGIIRIIIDKKLNINLGELVQQSFATYKDIKLKEKTTNNVLLFIADRLIQWLIAQGFTKSQCAATMVSVIPWHQDLHAYVLRLKAVKDFCELPEAVSLAAANKRVNNILEKQAKLRTNPKILSNRPIDMSLLKENAEIELAKIISTKTIESEKFYQQQNYQLLLMNLAELKEPVDAFFDSVMVMVDDDKICLNRLALLAKLRDLFLKVADISLLKLENLK